MRLTKLKGERREFRRISPTIANPSLRDNSFVLSGKIFLILFVKLLCQRRECDMLNESLTTYDTTNNHRTSIMIIMIKPYFFTVTVIDQLEMNSYHLFVLIRTSSTNLIAIKIKILYQSPSRLIKKKNTLKD